NWDEAASLLAADGYDTVFYMAAYGPVIYGDGLRECLEACHPLGIGVYAWVVMWETDYITSDQQGSVLHGDRTPMDIDAGVIRRRIDLADPRNLELMAGTCLRIAAEYPVVGIHLDFIGEDYRLSDSSAGYSDLITVMQTGDMTAAVRAVRDSLSRINRVVLLSASVLPPERESLAFSQMWKRWLDDGLLDFAVTLNITESDSQFVALGEILQRSPSTDRID
ncbi:MAG: hypothetical protein ABFR50_12125, partial [Candidatus Fermentibacteria bacterium]